MGLIDNRHNNREEKRGERERVSVTRKCAQGIDEIGRRDFLMWFDTSLI